MNLLSSQPARSAAYGAIKLSMRRKFGAAASDAIRTVTNLLIDFVRVINIEMFYRK